MDTARDLGRVEPWRESLERSLERRGRLPRPSVELKQPPAGRAPASDNPARESVTSRDLRRRPIARRSMMLVTSAGGILTLGLLAATLPSLVDGGGASGPKAQVAFRPDARPVSLTHVRGASAQASATAARAPGSGGSTLAAGAKRTATCKPVARSRGYVNPLAGARVTPERIDQGVDYAGSGKLTAIGAARVRYIATSGTGWPGAFIEYQLVAGPDDGCYVYYAEGVTPVRGLRVGETVRAGQPIATIIPGYPSGIELGWAARVGTKTYAAKMGDWSVRDDYDNIPSAAGKRFSKLIASLGGPPGKLEG